MLTTSPASPLTIAIASEGQSKESYEWPGLPEDIAKIQNTMEKLKENCAASRSELTINNVTPAENSLDSLDWLANRFNSAQRLTGKKKTKNV